MTYKEIYDNLAADLKRVQIRQEYLRPKVIKEFKKERKFPAWRWYDYTIPSTNNKYVIYFYVENRMQIEKPIVGYFAIMFDENERYVIKWGAGLYKHVESNSMQPIRQLHAYSSHFFRRYNERLLKDEKLSANDIACRYFTRNKSENSVPVKMTEEINRRLNEYRETAQQYGYLVRDGFCFGDVVAQGLCSDDGDRSKDKIDAILVRYATFMNKLGLAEVQRDAIEEGAWNAWEQSMRDFQSDMNDKGELVFRLEK